MTPIPQLLQLPKILDIRGNLTFIEGEQHIPFEIKRAYWIYDVPGGESRGGHAFKEQQEFIVAMSGRFDVVLDTGTQKSVFQLNRSYNGLFVPKGVWRHIENFCTNSLALVLASTAFDERDYIRNYKEFVTFVNAPIMIQPIISSFNNTTQIELVSFNTSTIEDC